MAASLRPLSLAILLAFLLGTEGAWLAWAEGSGNDREPAETGEWASQISPYLPGKSARRSAGKCANVLLSPANLIGILYQPMDEQTVQAKLLYRERGDTRDVAVRLMKEDARALTSEIASLQRNERSRPIILERAITKEGECSVTQVSG